MDTATELICDPDDGLGEESGRGMQAVIFNVDGLLVESEEYWDRARRDYLAGYGGIWTDADQRNVMGLNSLEWAHYIRTHFPVGWPDEQIIAEIKARVLDFYREHVPAMPGAVESVRMLAPRYPLGVASSSPRTIIEAVLESLGIRSLFAVVVSSDEVPRGKPSPDVYLEAARQLDIEPQQAVVFEDSPNGVQAAKAAGMCVIAVPNRQFAAPDDVAAADVILSSLEDFHPDLLDRLSRA